MFRVKCKNTNYFFMLPSKNKNLLLAFTLITVTSLLAFTTDVKTDSYKAMPAKTSLNWTGYKLGGQHTGTIDLKSGSFTVKDSLISSGSFVIDMKSIKVTDSESKKLYDHIRGPEFFNVNQYPESKLVITSSEKIDSKHQKVTGNLTILDKTNPITFTATLLTQSEHYVFYQTDLSIDRTKYGITYKSSAVGDATIFDEFGLHIKLVGEIQ